MAAMLLRISVSFSLAMPTKALSETFFWMFLIISYWTSSEMIDS